MPKPLRFQQRLDRYPPILIRLLTQRGRGESKYVPTDQQIADVSGLTIADVKRLSYSTTWDGISIDVAYRFLTGCDIDLEKRRTFKHLEYMRRRGRFQHLRRSPEWPHYQELLEIGHAAGLWE